MPKGTFYNYHFGRKEVTQYKLRDEELKKQIMKIYTESERRFGAKKIMIKLQMDGVGATLNKVQ